MIPIQAYPSPLPQIRRLKERRAAIAALCSALEAYLSLDLDADIKMYEQLKDASATPSVTPEMLVSAQSQLAQMESAMERFNRALDNLPEDVRDLVSMQAEAVAPQVDNQRAYVKSLQDRLDGKCFSVLCECGALLLADGTTSRYPTSDAFSGTKEECAAKATECGWTVNGEDQTCPECAKEKA